ncbi:MAG: flagellar hook-associated protein FlgK [Pseudomonadota bacterium]
MAGLITTAISGLKLSQLALSISGQNIVNANTDGYSRQSISAATSTAMKTGAGFVGTGVTVTDIFRNTEQYLVDQVSRDISVLADFDAYLSNINQTDNLLASPSSSLATGMNNFFDALNESSNDPASLLGRQLLLTQTNMLTQNFKTLETKLLSQNIAINKQFDTLAANVTTIAKEIAQLNDAIGNSVGATVGKYPNDLLDRRDALVRDLSKFVEVSVVPQGNQTIDVFIGEGQGLVIGPNPSEVMSIAGPLQPDRREIAFRLNDEVRIVTNQLTGGELGGLVRFRKEALEPALASLGRIALALSDGINKQQHLGIDLEGNLGHSLFTDINDPVLLKNRVRGDSTNAPPNDRQLSVMINDVSQLTTSTYKLDFPGPGLQYSLLREADSKLVAQGVLGDKLPHKIEVDGFSINIASGSFQAGDKFQIQPTTQGASDIKVLITRPEAFAFASPVRTQTSAGNQGGAFILPGKVTDITTAAFTSVPGELSPPILIRFTSPTTYDVLDYSDPANPVSLRPPLNNQRFSPGVVNDVFPDDPGGTSVSTLGSGAARANLGLTNNGYQEEMVTLLTTDPVNGYVTETRVQLGQNQTAAQIAQQLSGLNGISASALTRMQLSEFRSDGSGAPLTLTLNGVELTDPRLVLAGELLPQVVPDPLTADFVRDRINTNKSLTAMGIFAESDGTRLTVRSTTGVDLQVKVSGNAGDSVTVRDGDLRSIVGRKNMNAGVNIAVNSSFTIDTGLGKTAVALTPGNYAARDVLRAVQKDIDNAMGAGVVKVELNASGFIELRSARGERTLTVSNITGGDPLGIEPLRITGPDRGAMPAVYASGLDARNAFNFSAQNGSFLLSVDDAYSDSIMLNQSYAAGDGSALVADIQAQIDASAGLTGLNGRVTVDLDDNGVLRFTSTSQGADSVISLTAGSTMQDLVVTGSASGEQTSGSNAMLTGNISISAGFDFTVNGPHQFEIGVNGQDKVLVTLTGSAADASEVVDLIGNAINAALTANGSDPVTVGVDGAGLLTIASQAYGSASQVAISAVQGTYGALFQGSSRGVSLTSDFTIGGTVDVQLAANTRLSSNRTNGLFGSAPVAQSNFMGYQVSINSGQGISGAPQAGDTFLVSYNTDGSADNRNGAAMLSLNNDLTLSNGNLTYQGAYGQLVENLGILTSQGRLSQAASETLLRQSMSALQSVSGVNMDEEAARLIQFEQHYNASARLISMAKEMFDALLSL